jgi:hypothetical protein
MADTNTTAPARRFHVATTERHGVFYFSVVDSTNGELVLEEGQELSYYFDGAAMLNSGLGLEATRELLAVRPIGKKCGC